LRNCSQARFDTLRCDCVGEDVPNLTEVQRVNGTECEGVLVVKVRRVRLHRLKVTSRSSSFSPDAPGPRDSH